MNRVKIARRLLGAQNFWQRLNRIHILGLGGWGLSLLLCTLLVWRGLYLKPLLVRVHCHVWNSVRALNLWLISRNFLSMGGRSDDYTIPFNGDELIVLRWSLFWRRVQVTIYLGTLFDYCRGELWALTCSYLSLHGTLFTILNSISNCDLNGLLCDLRVLPRSSWPGSLWLSLKLGQAWFRHLDEL